MDSNPNQSPPTYDARKRRRSLGLAKAIGTSVLVLGLATLAYGALAFWVFPLLPPNGGVNGRLPSLYVMGAGIIAAVVGLTLRGWDSESRSEETAHVSRKSIPTGIGIAILFAIVVAVFVVISRM